MSIDLPEQANSKDAAQSAKRSISFNSEFTETPIYDRVDLPTDRSIPGPAIIEEDGATTVVPPEFSAKQDRYGILTLTREGA